MESNKKVYNTPGPGNVAGAHGLLSYTPVKHCGCGCGGGGGGCCC